MLKIVVEQWDKNKDNLRKVLAESKDMNNVQYKDVVKLTFDIIYNHNLDMSDVYKLDTLEITEIDNGNCQGTLLYLIPFNTYQPTEREYLMTYVGYGSCSVCDTLLGIQSSGSEKLTKNQIDDFMVLCKDILTNTILPYNHGWRKNDFFKEIQEEI